MSSFSLDDFDTTLLVSKTHFKDLFRDVDKMILKSNHNKLRLVRQLLDLFSDALAVHGVKSAIKFVHDVEWSCVDFLNGKDEACCHDSFLASGQSGQ